MCSSRMPCLSRAGETLLPNLSNGPLSAFGVGGLRYIGCGGVVVMMALAFGRHRKCSEEVVQWQRASQRLNTMCPPPKDTATLWCKVVDRKLVDEPASGEPLALAKPPEPRAEAKPSSSRPAPQSPSGASAA